MAQKVVATKVVEPAPKVVAPKVATTNVATTNVAKKKVVEVAPKVVAQEAPTKVAKTKVANTNVAVAPNVLKTESQNPKLPEPPPSANTNIGQSLQSIHVPEPTANIIKSQTNTTQLVATISELNKPNESHPTLSQNTSAVKPATANTTTANTAIKPTNTINPAINPANTSTVKPASANITTASTPENTKTIKKATQQANVKADALYQTYISYKRNATEIEEHKNKLTAIADKAQQFSFLKDLLGINTSEIWKTFVPNAFIGDPQHVQKRIAYLENTILPHTKTKYDTLKQEYDNAVKNLNERLKPVSEQHTQASTINVNNKTLKLTQTEFDAQKSLLDTQFNNGKQALIEDVNTQFYTECASDINADLSEATKNNANANAKNAIATAISTVNTATVNANAKLNIINSKTSLNAQAQEPVYANLTPLNNTKQTAIYANVPAKGGKRTILTKKQKHIIRNKCVRSHKSHNKKLRTRKTHMKRRTMLKKHKLN